MKNSATDRIRARLTNPQSPSSDLGVAPGNSSSPASVERGGAVSIDEAYLAALFGPSGPAETPQAAEVAVAEAEVAQVAELQQSDFTEAAELADQNSSTEGDLFAFHSAIQESYTESPTPEAFAAVETPTEPVVSAPAIPVERSTPVQPRSAAPPEIKQASPVAPTPVSRSDAPASRNKENQRRVVKIASPMQRTTAKVNPVQESAPQSKPQWSEPVAPASKETSVPLVAPAWEPAGQEASAAGGKNKMILIAAGAVVLMGGGFLMFRSGPAPQPTPQAQVAAPQSNVPEPEISATVSTQTAATSAVGSTTPTPAQPAATPKPDAAKATPQPATPPPAEVRAAPKQFVPPTVANRAPAVAGLVADAPPVVATNSAAGVVGLPGNVSVASVIAPPPVAPKAPEPVTPAAATAAPPQNPPAIVAKPAVATVTRIKTVNPAYPASARAARVAGPVVLSVTIGKDGKVTGLKAISGQPLLVGAARDAVSQWLYNPPTINGQPTEANIQVELNFKLP